MGLPAEEAMQSGSSVLFPPEGGLGRACNRAQVATQATSWALGQRPPGPGTDIREEVARAMVRVEISLQVKWN